MKPDFVPTPEQCAIFLGALTNAENYDGFIQRLTKHYNVATMNLLVDPTMPQDLTSYYDPETKTLYAKADCTPEIVLTGFYQHLLSEGTIKDPVLTAQMFAINFLGKAKAYDKFQECKQQKPSSKTNYGDFGKTGKLEVIINGQRII